jgi:hypothetical protein
MRNRVSRTATVALGSWLSAGTALALCPYPTPKAAGLATQPVSSDGAERRPWVTEHVHVKRPMIVAFLPSEVARLRDTEVGASEAAAHVEFALADTRSCLKRVRVETRVVFAEELIIQQDGRSRRVKIPTDAGKTVGAYLLAPGRQPCVVYATAGPSSLTLLLPAAAGQYFDVPACRDDSVAPQCKG